MKITPIASAITLTSCLALTACAETSTPSTDTYPSKSVRLVVPFPAGSATDVGTRVIGDCVEKELGESLVIENIDGGDGLLAMREVSQAKSDGYTLAAASTSTLLVAPHFVQDAGFETASFDVVGAYSVTPMLLAVAPDSPFKSIDDALASSDALTVVTPGPTSSGGLAIKSLDQANPVTFNQIPAGSEADAVRGLGTGDYDIAMLAMSPSVLDALKSQIRPLALTSEFTALPEVPTLDSLGHGAQVPIPEIIGSWVVPAGTPEGARSVLAGALGTCTTSDEIREKLGAVIPEEFIDGPAVETANNEAMTKIEALDQ